MLTVVQTARAPWGRGPSWRVGALLALLLAGGLLVPFLPAPVDRGSIEPEPSPAKPPHEDAWLPPPLRGREPSTPTGDPPVDEPPPDPGTDPATGPNEPPVAFGMDAGSLAEQRAAGFDPDYATLWLGPWTLVHGWGGPDRTLERLVREGVTPAVHLYYWGDDISPACLQNGCWSSLHDVRKDPAGWQRLVEETVDHFNETLDGAPVLVLLESEFNKADVATYEPLDAALAEKARFIQRAYPPATVVISLGNWNHAAWSTWDRAAAAADAIGIQAIRASTRDTLGSTIGLYNATSEGVWTLSAMFRQPIVLQDISVSSYPEPAYLEVQAKALDRLFDGLPELERMGVDTVLYRSWFDTPSMSTENYFGIAERYWGVVSYPDRVPKPAMEVWLDGVADERRDGLPEGPLVLDPGSQVGTVQD